MNGSTSFDKTKLNEKSRELLPFFKKFVFRALIIYVQRIPTNRLGGNYSSFNSLSMLNLLELPLQERFTILFHFGVAIFRGLV